MEYLIKLLGAKTGQGHVSILKAVQEEFENKGIHTLCYPSFYEDAAISNAILSDFNNMLSMKSIELSISLNEFFFLEGKQINGKIYESYLNYCKKTLMDKKQIVISFTPLINKYVIKFLKESGGKSKFYIFVTDPYDPMYPGFEVQGADGYLCPNVISKEQLLKHNINESDITICGFPLQKRFLYKNKINIRKTQEIYTSTKKTPILINCGVYGNSKFISFIKKLLIRAHVDYFFIIVCGNNKVLKQILSSYCSSQQLSNALVLGFVDNMHELLSISIFCITKAGANAIHECIACKTIPLITSFWGLQYQERGVFDYLKKFYDFNIRFNDENDLIAFLERSYCYDEIEKEKKKFIKTQLNGAQKIVEKIIHDTLIAN